MFISEPLNIFFRDVVNRRVRGIDGAPLIDVAAVSTPSNLVWAREATRRENGRCIRWNIRKDFPLAGHEADSHGSFTTGERSMKTGLLSGDKKECLPSRLVPSPGPMRSRDESS